MSEDQAQQASEEPGPVKESDANRVTEAEEAKRASGRDAGQESEEGTERKSGESA